MTVWAIVFTIALCLEVLILNLHAHKTKQQFLHTFKCLTQESDVILLRDQLLDSKQCRKSTEPKTVFVTKQKSQENSKETNLRSFRRGESVRCSPNYCH